ncbi:MAG: DUF2167 domain-containing protein [Verrucomicrobia bacterium]|nr:DUF2167 domain-containing protein [Verrucomicrobiota bacterium]
MKSLNVLNQFAFISAFAVGMSTLCTLHSQEEEVNQEQELRRIVASLEKKSGTIELPSGVAVLNLGDEYVYYGPQDSQIILSEIWGNPPDSQLLEGMVFPKGASPLDEKLWAFTISYTQDGHVDDKDAESINYAELLESMQNDVRESNSYREQNGYSTLSLIGWASEPFYDKENHKLHWAKEIRFHDSNSHTLNYNIRVLGRLGVLELNFIADMDQLDEIEAVLPEVLQTAEFTSGNKYSDFNPQYDKLAAYGIGGLIAGKMIAKTGIVLKILLVLKKFWVVLAVAIGALVSRLKKKNSEAAS